MLVKKIFRTAFQYKAQFFSMILMIALGIGIFLGFNIEWQSIESDTSQFFEETKYADFRLYSQEGFSAEEIRAIQNMDQVEAATRFFSAIVGIQDTKQTIALHVSENNTVSTMYLIEGAEYDDTSDGIWLSNQFADENHISIGDSLTLVYQGLTLEGPVVGLVKSGEEMICVADENQLMPDYKTHGFAYISPKKLSETLGEAFYPQINVISSSSKSELETALSQCLGRTILTISKDLHTAYAGACSEIEEGKTMGAILPVLFLTIAILTMVTTMHRIAANEKVQIGTLKALGFRDRKILAHYTSYGLFIGLAGTLLGILLGYGVAALIMSPSGMMATYFDLPNWDLVMPSFCIPVLLLTNVFLTWISYASVRNMLKGTAADALRPYAPKKIKSGSLEQLPVWNRLSFSMKWNLRDILRHKTRSAMTLLGVLGCMILLVGGLGMRDTMNAFLNMLNEEICQYKTKVTLGETTSREEALALVDELHGDWLASSGISYQGDTVTLEIYNSDCQTVGFLTPDNDLFSLSDEGVYLCLRLKDTAHIGDTITFSPYGSDETYTAKVAGYYRSLITESIIMTDTYADTLGVSYHIDTIYTNTDFQEIAHTSAVTGKQDKDVIMESYESFMGLLNLMILMLVIAAMILSIVVLYNLGIMSYVERRRELATLKVLGFRDKAIGRLLISQNLWLTVLGILLGIPCGIGVLQYLLTALVSEYELSLCIGWPTMLISTFLTLGVSYIVGRMVSRKNKWINMVEALKDAE